MDIDLQKGVYVLAVSGGVDSVVLLDVLTQRPNTELIVAHFDHGIREDSTDDRQFVATLSQKYGLPFEFSEGNLGEAASEEQARQARYEFLQQVRKKHNAQAIIIAHHKDDALETMVFNVLRGTKRKGMSSLQSTDGIVRPLLDYSKQDIRDYATKNSLQWREDSTNKEEIYTRNWIRRKLLPKLSRRQKQDLVDSYTSSAKRNRMLDKVVQDQLDEIKTGDDIDRRKFASLPYSVASEVMAEWLREQGIKDFDSKLVGLLVVSAKTLSPGKRVSISHKVFLHIEDRTLSVH